MRSNLDDIPEHGDWGEHWARMMLVDSDFHENFHEITEVYINLAHK